MAAGTQRRREYKTTFLPRGGRCATVVDRLSHPPACLWSLLRIPPTGNQTSGLLWSTRKGGSSPASTAVFGSPLQPTWLGDPSLPAHLVPSCSSSLFGRHTQDPALSRQALRVTIQAAPSGPNKHTEAMANHLSRRKRAPPPPPGIHFLTRDVYHLQVTHHQCFCPPPARHLQGSFIGDGRRGLLPFRGF